MSDAKGNQARFKIANQLLKEGKLREARSEYKKIISHYPELISIAKFNIELIDKKIESTVALQDIETEEENIFIGIAAIPDRVNALEATIKSLINQVDKIGVYLNGWSHIPEFLKNKKIILGGFKQEDLGDVGKFYWVDGHDGIYFTCDDDLIYPPDYVKRTLAKLKQYEYKAAIGWHGSVLREPFENYYNKDSRRVFVFSADRLWDTPVHILGTGCSAFHTRALKIKRSDFKHPNMADIFFSIKGQEQKVPFFIMEHEAKEIQEFEGAAESSIYTHSHAGIDSKKNTHQLQNEFVKKNLPWVLNEFQPLKVLIIGRFENYSKGGIYKSCHLIKSSLSAAGHSVDVQDTQSPLNLEAGNKYDLCWIYPGDPERPDFSTVEEKILRLQENGIPVIVNLSYLYEDERTKWIKRKLLEFNKNRTHPVLGAVFTETAANDPILREVRQYLCVVPKTLLPTPYERIPAFSEREGICLGDATKLGNTQIIGGSINPWIDEIHKRLPHVNLYAYKQYQGSNPHPKVKYVPHMGANFGEWLAHRKIFICANVHLTFEMVACESQSYGTPTVYRHMPHSLSEYISATGLAVRSPKEMAEMIAWLYNSESAWKKFSESATLNAKSKHIDLLDASLEGYLRLAIFRIKELTERNSQSLDA